ncbi:hypothetical protein PPO43_06095 [Saprospira sp. CCB-QB6]|uniref:hypothetical protein n=1 Tax=Saprospira sp. CCB-QB6 TaxID=3023936 RepID=UPI00234BC466|nr:hypothetical protein [Saprospira sp. CCB-QB6]WCL82667.1 hypothetical protein PPO43_06095 [Saprospira sp. CCB-QB6]
MRFALFFFPLLLMACSSGPSAAKYAKKFCDCSETLAKAKVQLDNGRMEADFYADLEAKQKECMGQDNPFSQLKTAADSLAFEQAFLQELAKQCPSTARNYGYTLPETPAAAQ